MGDCVMNDVLSNKGYTLVPRGKISPDVSPKQEGTLDYLGRSAARTGVRAAESIAGLPGDVSQSLYNIGNYVSGGFIPNAQQVRDFSKEHPIISTLLAPLTAPAFIPGSQDIKQAHESFTGDYFKPQTPAEEFYDSIIGDAASLFVPEVLIGKGIKAGGSLIGKAGKALGLATAGNTASKTVEQLGGGPLSQGIAKFTAMTLPYGATGRIKQSYNNSYKLADEAIAKSDFAKKPASLHYLIKDADQIKKSVVGNKEAGAVNNLVQDIKDSFIKTKNGKTSYQANLKELVDLKHNLNSHYQSGLSPLIKNKISDLGKLVDDKIKMVGKNVPGFLEPYSNAQALFGEYAQASKLINKIKGVAKSSSPVHKILASVPGIGVGYAGYGVPAAITGAGIYGTFEAARMFNLLKNSPQAAKIYRNMFENAATGSSAAIARDVAKLDKMFEDQPKTYTLKPRGKQ